MLILRIFGYHFFIITNYQKIVAKFIILITNRFFPLVSRRQRFFYTVCYKLPSQKMRTRSLCFLLCFCFLVFYFHFFLLLSFLLHGMLQAPVAEDESQLVCFPFLFVFVLFSFSFFLFLYFLSFFSITQFATSSGPRRWGPGSFVFLYTFLVSCFSCLFFYQFSSSPYIWFSSSSLLYFPLPQHYHPFPLEWEWSWSIFSCRCSAGSLAGTRPILLFRSFQVFVKRKYLD